VVVELQRVEACFRKLGPVSATKVSLEKFVPSAALSDPSQTGGRPALEYYPTGGGPGGGPPGGPAPAPPGARPALTYNYPQAKALFAFAPQSQDELGFQPGEILQILTQDGMWWTAKNSAGRQGAIPSNYVQLI